MTAEQHEKIYNAFYGKVMVYIRARINRKAEAEDLCADVFEKIQAKLDGYDSEKAGLSTWIYCITRNSIIDFYRKSRPAAHRSRIWFTAIYSCWSVFRMWMP